MYVMGYTVATCFDLNGHHQAIKNILFKVQKGSKVGVIWNSFLGEDLSVKEDTSVAFQYLNYNWINQLSNTTIWWLDICHLLLGSTTCFGSYGHLQVDRLTTKLVSSYTLACVLCMVEGGLGLDGGTRSRVC